jgi:hypothetical protein
METVFPSEDGYAGSFLVGFRKNPDAASQTQRVGTAVLKRTYDIEFNGMGTLNGRLAPAGEPLPVFDQDQPDMEDQTGNLVTNGDFEMVEDGELVGWQAESGATISQVEDPDTDGNHLMQVTGDPNRRITQTISLPAPLGRHRFALYFTARADAATTVTAQLEASGSTLCTITETLQTTMKSYVARGQWPDGLAATEMVVVVETAAAAGRTVFYDNVTVFALIHFEHDLAPFKPEGDLVVLDFVDVTGLCSLRVDGALRLERSLGAGESNMFGWASRSEEDTGMPDSLMRAAQAGEFSDNPDAYPPEWPPSIPLKDPLPDDFNNSFYNGYDRAAAQEAGSAPLPYLEPADFIQIVRPGPSNDYSFALGEEAVSAHYEFYSGFGPDKASYWQRRSVSMNLDTLVIEPENNRCYTVWRGAWNYDDHPEDAYRHLVITAT